MPEMSERGGGRVATDGRSGDVRASRGGRLLSLLGRSVVVGGGPLVHLRRTHWNGWSADGWLPVTDGDPAGTSEVRQLYLPAGTRQSAGAEACAGVAIDAVGLLLLGLSLSCARPVSARRNASTCA
jgi:hypothetical protein